MLSVVVLTKNEKTSLDACLSSVKFADEVIVIDDNSKDSIREIAAKYDAIIYTKALQGDFSAQRNFGLNKAKGEWVLFIDADEVVSTHLQNEILDSIKNTTDVDGFYLRRDDYFGEKRLRYGETSAVRLLRLAKKSTGVWVGNVHETWEIHGKKSTLTHPLIHRSHTSIDTFLQKINFYTDIRSEELFLNGKKVYWYEIIFYPLGKFVTNYLFKKGFLDGVEGTIMALFMSFHSFLVRGKLWQLWDQKKLSH